MAAIQEFEKEKLIIGVIYHEKEVLEGAMKILVSEFGEVEETSILINVNELHEDKRKRHIMTFVEERPEYRSRIKGTKVLFPLRKRRERK